MIKKLYPKVDFSKITPKMAIKMGVKGDLESSLESIEGSVKELGRPTIEMNTTEAIAVEPISVVAPIVNEDLEADKKLDLDPTMEPAIVDTRKPEQPKKELTKESSNAPVITK